MGQKWTLTSSHSHLVLLDGTEPDWTRAGLAWNLDQNQVGLQELCARASLSTHRVARRRRGVDRVDRLLNLMGFIQKEMSIRALDS